jgi:hypothetical protein
LFVVLVLAALISISALDATAVEIVKIDNYNISVDFGESQVKLSPMVPFMVGELNVKSVGFSSQDANGSVAVGESPFSEPHAVLVSNCKRVLELIMKQTNANVDVTPYEDGFIGTGEDIATGSHTYGILKPDDVEFGRASRVLIVIATSKNDETSKSIITSVKSI